MFLMDPQTQATPAFGKAIVDQACFPHIRRFLKAKRSLDRQAQRL